MDSYECCSKSSHKHKSVSNLSKLLRLIGDKSRLQILCILHCGEHCVCDIITHLNLSQSLTSHHLRDLRTEKIIESRKEGKKVYYSLTNKGVNITNLIFSL